MRNKVYPSQLITLIYRQTHKTLQKQTDMSPYAWSWDHSLARSPTDSQYSSASKFCYFFPCCYWPLLACYRCTLWQLLSTWSSCFNLTIQAQSSTRFLLHRNSHWAAERQGHESQQQLNYLPCDRSISISTGIVLQEFVTCNWWLCNWQVEHNMRNCC